jgi:hypothetical protein
MADSSALDHSAASVKQSWPQIEVLSRFRLIFWPTQATG